MIYFSIVVLSIGIIAAQDIALHNIPGRGIRVLEFPLEKITTGGRHESRENILYLRDSDSLSIPFPPEPFGERFIFGIPQGILLMSINRAISLCIVLLLIGGMIRLAQSFLKNQNERKALENAHLNAEVNFLKSQINPHFLFNTLNSIYSQAHSKSEHTEYSILKLSDLLRYVLYETGEEKVPLEKDILYINNYIDLQRMRISSKVTINYSTAGNIKGFVIAPLLLISFIENAFKHGVSYSQSSVINIEIRVFEKTLTLLVSNPVVKTDTFATGGLGLKNVTRRLELIYPNRHQLETYQNEYLYIVNLKIELESD